MVQATSRPIGQTRRTLSPYDAYPALGTPGPETRLRLWDLESGEGHDRPVIDALPVPDGRRALSWSDDHTLRLWDLAERHEIKRFVSDDFITTVALAVQRQLLLAVDAGGRIMPFELLLLIWLGNRRHA